MAGIAHIRDAEVPLDRVRDECRRLLDAAPHWQATVERHGVTDSLVRAVTSQLGYASLPGANGAVRQVLKERLGDAPDLPCPTLPGWTPTAGADHT